MIAASVRRWSRRDALAVLLGLWAAGIALATSRTTQLALAVPALVVMLIVWTATGLLDWLSAFFVVALLTPPLPIQFGNTGPHLAVLLAALGLIAGVWRLNEWRITPTPLLRALVRFQLVLFISAAIAAVYSGPEIAAGSLARVLLFAISVYVFSFVYMGPAAGDRPWRRCRLLFGLAVAAAAFACLDFYYQFPTPAGFGPQFIWLDTGVFRRAQGLFYEASTLGNFCSFFLVMIVVALFQPAGQRPCSRWALSIGGGILLVALILSYSRASLLNLITACCALVYLRRGALRRSVLAAVLCFGLGAAGAVLLFPAFAQTYLLRLSASLEYFWSAPNGVLSGRLANWQYLLDFLAREPWHAVFGIGYKTLPYSDYIGSTVIADNTYLSLLVETGIIGLLVFLFLQWAILRTGWKASRSTNTTASFFGTWIFCFWTGEMVQMLSGDLITYWRVLPVYFWVLAVAARYTGRPDEHPIR